MKKWLVFLIALGLLFAGCSTDNETPVNNPAADNPEASVPPEVQGALEANAPSEEIIENEISRAAASVIGPTNPALNTHDVYCVTFLWGDVFATNAAVVSPAITYNWSGSFDLFGAGAIRTIHRIDFEENQDYLLPDNLPEIESWVSYTAGDFDGLSFLVYVDRNQVIASIPRVTFTTALITLTYDVFQLEKLAEFHPVGSTAGVAVIAHKIKFRPCREGIIEGRWMRETSFAGNGTFKGFWIGKNGDRIGEMNGTWTKNDPAILSGGGSMEGTVVDPVTNRVIVVLRGSWNFDDPRMCALCGEGHGQFRGKFWYRNVVAANARPDGHFEGEFGDFSLPPDDLVMPMTGKWKANCPSVLANDPWRDQ